MDGQLRDVEDLQLTDRNRYFAIYLRSPGRWPLNERAYPPRRWPGC